MTKRTELNKTIRRMETVKIKACDYNILTRGQPLFYLFSRARYRVTKFPPSGSSPPTPSPERRELSLYLHTIKRTFLVPISSTLAICQSKHPYICQDPVY